MARTPKNQGLVVDLDEEESIGNVGMAGKVVPVKSQRKTGTPRPSYDEAMHCPHCQGRMHMNLPVSTVNFECMYRQYLLATKQIDSPDARLIPFTADMLSEMTEWADTRRKSRKNPLSYGKMASSDNSPSTYAAMRAAKTVDEVADEVDVKPKTRKTKNVAVIPEEPVKRTAKAGKPAPKVAATNGKASRKEFSMSASSLVLDEDEAPVKRVAKTGSKPAPKPLPAARKPVAATAAQKTGKAAAPKPAVTGVARKAALAKSR